MTEPKRSTREMLAHLREWVDSWERVLDGAEEAADVRAAARVRNVVRSVHRVALPLDTIEEEAAVVDNAALSAGKLIASERRKGRVYVTAERHADLIIEHFASKPHFADLARRLADAKPQLVAVVESSSAPGGRGNRSRPATNKARIALLQKLGSQMRTIAALNQRRHRMFGKTA